MPFSGYGSLGTRTSSSDESETWKEGGRLGRELDDGWAEDDLISGDEDEPDTDSAMIF